MVLEVNHEEMRRIIYEYYKRKLALFIWGTFGVGKSQGVLQTAEKLAKESGREFVEWNKITKEKKQDVFEYCEKYFVLIDIRLSEYDSSDIKGLPDFRSNNGDEEARDFIEWKSPFFAKLLAKENADGICFFDEINLSTPLVLASCYKIIYDRIINDEKVGDNWGIIGCGNKDSDRAFTHTLPSPLKDRGGEIELVVPTIEDWTKDFAIPNKIDSRIIGYLNFKASSLRKVDFDDNQKFVTPRGWERVNTLIKDVEGYKNLSLICKSAIGQGIAHEFISFCKIQEKMKLEDVIKNPEKLKKIKGIDVKYFLVSVLAERYSNNKVDFEKIIQVSKVLDEIKDAEFVALLWRLCSTYTEKTEKFRNDFLDDNEHDKFTKKYKKFIL